jgi:hypothetical protein
MELEIPFLKLRSTWADKLMHPYCPSVEMTGKAIANGRCFPSALSM